MTTNILSTISGIGFFLVFLAGLAMAFNPRSLMIIPVVMGYTAGPLETRSFKRPLAFVLGITVADIALGILFAFIGNNVSAVFWPRWESVIGFVLILLGLRWLNVVHFRGMGREL